MGCVCVCGWMGAVVKHGIDEELVPGLVVTVAL